MAARRPPRSVAAVARPSAVTPEVPVNAHSPSPILDWGGIYLEYEHRRRVAEMEAAARHRGWTRGAGRSRGPGRSLPRLMADAAAACIRYVSAATAGVGPHAHVVPGVKARPSPSARAACTWRTSNVRKRIPGSATRCAAARCRASSVRTPAASAMDAAIPQVSSSSSTRQPVGGAPSRATAF
jgi:hypothetical protein